MSALITLDQSKIAAEGFPRAQAWWDGWLPQGWTTGTVHEDGTVTIDVIPAVRRRPHQDNITRRSRELALLRWLGDCPALEPAIVEDAGERCRCWYGAALPHDGHCCFREARVCHSLPLDMRAIKHRVTTDREAGAR